jgi:hypothetical protein
MFAPYSPREVLMNMREFESKLKKLTSVASITYGRKLEGKVFELDAIFVHTISIECHLEVAPDCMKKQLAYFENLSKKES